MGVSQEGSGEGVLRRGSKGRYPPLTARSLTYGNRSARGKVALARLLTVTQTCKLQQRPVLNYLVDAVHCHRRRQPVASLRPR